MKLKNFIKVSSVLLTLGIATSCQGTTTDTFDTTKNITLYSRASDSGTRECFFENIGYSEVAKSDEWEEGANVSIVGSNAEMMSKISSDDYSIGYCSLDSLSSVSGIKGLKYEGVEASEANVLNGTYKLKRNFNFVLKDYSNDATKKQAVEGFIAFLNETTEGQTVIKENGGIVENKANLKTFDSIKSEYPVFSSSDTVSIQFCGSTSVEKIVGAAVSKLTSLITNKNLTYTLNQTGSGNAVKGILGELSDNKDYGIGFLSREISSDELTKLSDKNTKGSFAIDAVVPIVNSKNTYTETTASELTSIYKGQKTVWSDVIA